MFSSSGYFRGVTCPYYASGLCERPYCHFRHVKPTTPGAGIRQDSLSQRDNGTEVGAEDGAASEAIPAGQSSQSSSLLNMVGQAIKQVQRDIERDKATLCSIKTAPGPVGGGAVGPSGAVGPGSAVYKPTPIGAKTSSGTSSGAGGLYGTRTTVPEYDPVKPRAAQYKPTPIKLLEKQKEATKGPGLYTMDAAGHVNENEYDPATNFSTKGKGVAVKRPGGTNADSSKVKRLKVVEEEEDDDTHNAAFSDDEEIDETPESDQLSMEYLEAQRKADKKIQLQKESGVFTMDVDAILGVPGKGSETGKQTSAKVTKEKSSQKRSSASKSQTTSSGRDRSSSSSSNKNTSKEKSTVNKSSSQSVNLEKKDKRETETKEKSRPSEQVSIKVKMEKSQCSEEVHVKDDKSRHVEHKTIKEEGSSEDRNIFSILIGDLPETSNDSSVPGSIKTNKNGGSNKENDKSYSAPSKQTCDKVSSKQSSSGSSVERSSSSHHRTHSSRDDKDHSDKKDRSSKSPSHHKSDSSHKHSHSSSSKRHRTSSGSSSSSSKQSHKTGSSSSGHRSSSHDRHQSTSKSHHSSSKGSSHSSTKSTSHSSTKDHDHKSSRSHHHEKTSSKPAHAEVGAKGAQIKPRTERLVSHVDLFGEDSDGSDDVIFVEPPKVHIPVVELSSEESDVEDCPMVTEVPEPQTGYIDTPDIVGMMSDDDDEENDSLPEEDMPGLDESLLTEDTYDECLRIFNEESSRSAKPQQQPRAKVPEPEDEEPADQFIGKKRVARVTEKEAAITRKAPPTKSNVRPSASQVMHNRFLAIQKAAQEAVNRGDESQSGKGRVAHKPATSLIKADQTGERKHTPITSVAKSIGSLPANRKAHTPSKATPKRPTIPADYGSKVPTAVRQRYLNMFIDEALKIYHNEKDAFDRALEEEKVVNGRSSSKNVYLNLAVNCIKKLRAESSTGRGDKSVTPTKAGHRQFSHEALLGGKLAAKTSFTVKRSGPTIRVPESFSPVQLYNLLRKYVLTPEQLVDNGFPIMSEDKPGTAIIKENEQRKLRKSNKADERFCVRCGKWFLLTPDGDYVYQEECVYHWGKSWKRKIGNSLENRYTCCQEDASSTGCCVNKGHVHEQNKYDNFIGYMQTMPRSPPLDGNYGVFALDCEMVYTAAGIELARITVINEKLESVYEQVVLPEKPIIDPNTRFSGLKEEDFVGVTTSIRDIQAVLLSMFSADTILIGHSLESDLTALKLVHNTVVDTSVVFPHRLGPPYKRALRTLMSEILQKIIQEGVGGHDSQEDANSAMELMIWKLKDDMKNAPRK